MIHAAGLPGASEAPEWLRDADRLLAEALSRVRLIGRCTPVNATSELAALTADVAAGRARHPAFQYQPATGRDPAPILEHAAERWSEEGPLGELYAGRAAELALEARLCRTVGEPGFVETAARRYARRDPFHDDADRLVDAWLAESPSPRDRPVISDDEGDPASLLSRLRAEIGARRLPLRVVPAPTLASLAATGPGVIYVACGVRLHRSDVERTVLHEIEGHACPRLVAAGLPLGLFALGSAGGSDDQEGRALLLEQRGGWLDPQRRAELARRHHAGRCLRGGADFVEATRSLLEHGASVEDAVRIAARAYRGGGLGRELVYLPALLRVAACLEADPSVEAVLRAGQVSVEAAPLLADHLPSDHHAKCQHAK